MQSRIWRTGMRPINALVDITNYVMLATGQPTHAYDADCIHGHHLIARRAQEGEKLSLLNGKELTLDREDLVIADEAGTVGLAALGVFNGQLQVSVALIAGEGDKLPQGQVVEGRDLPGDAVMAPQIGAVGHGLVVDLQDDVVELQRVGQGGAGGGGEGGEIQNVGLLVGGEKIRQADLHGAADHAVAGHAPELALLDLHGLALAAVNAMSIVRLSQLSVNIVHSAALGSYPRVNLRHFDALA